MILSGFHVPLDFNFSSLTNYITRALSLAPESALSCALRKKSVDARRKKDIHFTLSVELNLRPGYRFREPLPKGITLSEEAPLMEPLPKIALKSRPLVVGLGPAGLFAALTLAEQGLCPTVIERGKRVEERQADVESFWRGGGLNPDSNVQFGEGGAGAFSDGKLNTGVRDARIRGILDTLYRAGAPESILYEAKPHIGTDHLPKVVSAIREKIIALGGEVRYETALTGVICEGGRLQAVRVTHDGAEEIISARHMILAIGHSARDTFEILSDAGFLMEQKPFSIGVRIEHPQKMIDRVQYGTYAGHPALGAADYKLAAHLKNGRGIYTFCMCPGGRVVAAASEAGYVVTNGMSRYARDDTNANAALLVNVFPSDFRSDHPLAGMFFQRKWERLAFLAGGGDYRAPAQLVGDFLAGRASKGPGSVSPSYLPGVKYTALNACLPGYVSESIAAGLSLLNQKLPGFSDPGAVMTGVETRSSSPIRILRGETGMASVSGVYPAGEGAGYAGGILSAAIDGIAAAESFITNEGASHVERI